MSKVGGRGREEREKKSKFLLVLKRTTDLLKYFRGRVMSLPPLFQQSTTAGIIKTSDGDRVVASSRRPDGT